MLVFFNLITIEFPYLTSKCSCSYPYNLNIHDRAVVYMFCSLPQKLNNEKEERG